MKFPETKLHGKYSEIGITDSAFQRFIDDKCREKREILSIRLSIIAIIIAAISLLLQLFS